jgi:hypothetical protein
MAHQKDELTHLENKPCWNGTLTADLGQRGPIVSRAGIVRTIEYSLHRCDCAALGTTGLTATFNQSDEHASSPTIDPRKNGRTNMPHNSGTLNHKSSILNSIHPHAKRA